jgi:adenylyltransferase/sulfurtransferase
MLVIDALAATTREVPLAPASDAARTPTVSLERATQLGATLLDVRTPAETAGGTLPGALTRPLADILDHPAATLAALRAAGARDTSDIMPDGACPAPAAPAPPVVVYCQQGPRARVAAHALAAAAPGADIRVLAGGYADHGNDDVSGDS